jgi:uncharacterized OB-fold protein
MPDISGTATPSGAGTRPVPPTTRLLPEIGPDTEAYWTGGAEGELRVYRCQDCRGWIHPPSAACWRCRSRRLGPEVTSGRGKVAAYTINVHPWLPGFPPPYIIAIVELDESPDVRFTTNIIDCDIEDVAVGLPVEVVFEHHEDVWLPLFRPIQSADQQAEELQS